MRIAIEPDEIHEIDLLGEVYTLKPITRAISARFAECYAKVDAAATADELVDAYGMLFDARFQQTREKQPKASTVIARAWKAEKVDLKALGTLLNEIGRLDRPT